MVIQFQPSTLYIFFLLIVPVCCPSLCLFRHNVCTCARACLCMVIYLLSAWMYFRSWALSGINLHADCFAFGVILTSIYRGWMKRATPTKSEPS